MVLEDTLAADNGSDQMGVELGKVLAKAILAQLDKPENVTGHDGSVSVFLFRPHPSPDTEISCDRRPVSFTTTRSTGRSRCKCMIVNDEACKAVTLLDRLVQKVDLQKVG